MVIDNILKTSIVIANHKSSEDQLLINTIESLKSEMNGSREVIVVNNGMNKKVAEKTASWLKEKRVKTIFVAEGNPSQARNMGAEIARGKYLLFLDNDVEVEKGAVGKVERYLSKHTRVGGGQLKLLRTNKRKKYDSAGEKLTAGGFLVERAREAEDVGQFDSDEPIFSGKGAAMLVKREIFEKVGGFDEDYQYYWEEPDLFWRVWKTGHDVRFLHMGMVRHAFMSDAKPVSRERRVGVTYLGCRNQALTILKNAVGVDLWKMILSVSLAWVGLGVMFLIQGDFLRAREVVRAGEWLIIHRGEIRVKRKRVQKELPSEDGWMKKIQIQRSWGWYYGKGISYVLGRPF